MGQSETYLQGKQQKAANDLASTSAINMAKAAASTADQQFNRANQKKPDIASLLYNNQQGSAPTSLTGSAGVGNSSLSLGKTTLLGG
ncbi:MAG: hypothetical protein PHP57_13470 [Sideroxydans sp.]|nr:hypothetical protein [Sideroxydans sp.]